METNSIKKENLYPFAIVFMFIAMTFLFVYHNEVDVRIKRVRLAGQDINVELAVTPEAHARGLSGRSTLGEGEGMLFVFGEPGEYLFWMKGMNFPIDIIWIDEGMKVVYIKENALPENYLETYGPEEDVLYVLEVMAGFSKENGLEVGDRVSFILTPDN